jgi:hypothetical protein
MKIALVHLVGTSPYSQSRHYDKEEAPEKPKESHDAYEQRTCRHRMHVTPDGFVEIPGSCFANTVKGSAKRLGLPVPGKRGAFFTKYFEAGIMCPDGIVLKAKAADVPLEKLFVPSDGKPGGGKRVNKWFPRIDKWEGDVKFYIIDDLITEDVFHKVLKAAGMLVGVGRFRPENRGFYGRFEVTSFKWLDDEEAMAAIGQAAE